MNIILTGNIVTPDKILKNNAVLIRKGIIENIISCNDIKNYSDYKIINFDNCKYICPGLIDIHTHGALRKDFMDCSIDSCMDLGKYYIKNGVTSFMATTFTAPKLKILKSVDIIKKYALKNPEDCSELLGIHIEGPYISNENPIFFGAQNPAYIKTITIEEVNELLEKGNGLIKRITIAPETTPDSYEIIKYLVEKNIVVSIGHSNANFEEARKAFNAGINLVTHFFNASGTWHHRATGIIGAALLDKRVCCEVICDGYHVHPSAIEMAYIIKTPEKMITITDSTGGAGLEDSEEFDLGGQKAVVKDGVCRLKTNGILAGSTLTLGKALSNISEWIDISLPQLINTASLNPARLFGIDNKMGSIEKGKQADIVVFDNSFKPITVLKKGKIVFRSQP